MTPTAGLRVRYTFTAADFVVERQVLTVFSVDSTLNIIETDHGTMTREAWDSWVASKVIEPLLEA